ncbi:MAG: hypothetical protein K6F00_05460 [Lachnospiraceae bacterium]|nr:hypothetical protein [Lachnospiraceae bacterium]
MAISKEDVKVALEKAEKIKNQLIGKDEDEVINILTDNAGIPKEIAKKIGESIKNVDLSKVDIRKIQLPDIPDGVKNILKK